MSSSRLPTSFPESLRVALDARNLETPCPSDVSARLLAMPYFQKSKAPPKTTNRFNHLMPQNAAPEEGRRFAHGGAGSAPSQWRPVYSGDRRDRRDHRDHRDSSGGFASRRDEPVVRRTTGDHQSSGFGSRRDEQPRRVSGDSRAEGDGFQVWSGRRRAADPTGTPTTYSPPHVATAETTVVAASPVETGPVRVEGPRFSSAAVKSTGETEDRILAKVKGKINKIGFTTYEATKTFMQQILDSDETEFLDEFMKFVFLKAATESAFCPLYAKLLHELADQFMHLRVVMTNIFRDYTAIFVEVETAPDVGTKDYKAFLEAQERKKFRRGYSQFVAELVKLGEADLDAFSELVQQIVEVLEASYNSPAKTLVCEEYIDCLANMCNSAPKILSNASWSDGVKGRLERLTKIPRSEAPGLTNKGRFAWMDLVDFAKRGWK